MCNNQNIIEVMLKHYEGKVLPKTILEYNKDYPKGYARTTLKAKYNLTGSELLKLINSEYIKSNDPANSSRPRLHEVCAFLNISPNFNIEETTAFKYKSFKFTCNTCGSVFTTTYDSIIQCSIGCRICAGNAKLTNEEIISKVESCGNYKVTSTLPKGFSRNNFDTVTMELQCLDCGNTFSRNTSYVVYRGNSKMCKVCHPDTDHRVDYLGITFSSKFEVECYKELLGNNISPTIHVAYNALSSLCKKRWTADFIVGNTIIEVTTYSSTSEYSKFITHAETLKKKETFANQIGYAFHVARSLPELRDIIKNHLM